MVRFPQKRFVFEKNEEIDSRVRPGDQNPRKFILKISTINLHRAGKLKRREKDRHLLSTEQVFFIN